MLKSLFYRVTTHPKLMKGFWRTAYNLLARTYRTDSWRFMNYGFSPAERPLFLTEETEPYGAQMYYRAVEGGDTLRDSHLLEIGCGRGGGVAYLHSQFSCDNSTGLDLAKNAISFCRKTDTATGLDYVVGSADDLPFESATFDVVVNVESSHTYPDIPKFLSEVSRVLKPGGRMYFVDFRRTEKIAELRHQLSTSGLTIVREEDITSGVVRALERDNDNKIERIESTVHPWFRSFFREFAGTADTDIYNGFHSGRNQYWAFCAEKPCAS